MKTILINLLLVFLFLSAVSIAEKSNGKTSVKNQEKQIIKNVQNSVPSITKRIKYNIAVLPKNWFEILTVNGTAPTKTKLVYNNDVAQEDFFDDLVCAVDDTEKVNLIERAKLQAIFNEQNLQNTGAVASDIKNQDKPVLGIHYYLTASWNKSGSNFIVRTRLFNIRTGEIITGRARKGDRYEAIEASVSKALNKLGNNAWYARIIRIITYNPNADVLRSDVKNGGLISDTGQNKEEYELEMLTGKKRTKPVTKVYISAGAKEGVLKDDRFYVIRDMGANAGARSLIDPETGSAVGNAEIKIGLIRVTEVYPGYSIGMIETETSTMQRGDRIIPFTGTFIPKDVLN